LLSLPRGGRLSQRRQADKNLIFNVKLVQPVQAYFEKFRVQEGAVRILW
jgi:hypothetical protein